MILGRPRWQLALGLTLVAGIAWWALRPARPTGAAVTVAVRKGPLDIKVLSGGNVEAMESQEIKCEVRGEQIKILRLVDEGYSVSPEDVRTNRVLVELDSSKLRQNLADQEISFQGTIASLTEAQQAFEIQVTQNRVDVKAAEQKANGEAAPEGTPVKVKAGKPSKRIICCGDWRQVGVTTSRRGTMPPLALRTRRPSTSSSPRAGRPPGDAAPDSAWAGAAAPARRWRCTVRRRSRRARHGWQTPTAGCRRRAAPLVTRAGQPARRAPRPRASCFLCSMKSTST